MRPRRAFGPAAVTVVLLALLASGAHAAPKSDADGDELTFADARATYAEYRHDLSADIPPERRIVDWAHAPLCNVNSAILEPGIDGECAPPNGTVNVPACGEDLPVEPLWRRVRADLSAPWNRWQMVVGWICPDDLLPPFTEADFRSLTIVSPDAHRQPATGDVLVNKPLIVYTEPDVERRFRTSLFGYGIDVVATPLEYTWAFGDGTELTTTSPGAPYPSFELTHDYRAPGAATVTLTTTWEGQYRVDEDPDGEWRDINGTAVTTVALDPFEVVELRTRLTDD